MKLSDMGLNDKQCIIQYVRNNKRHKIGAFAAIKAEDGEVAIGWSKWHPNDPKFKKFDEDRSLEIAIGRALKATLTLPAKSMESDLLIFLKRARKYFKAPIKYYDEKMFGNEVPETEYVTCGCNEGKCDCEKECSCK